jgi:pimeloyl-ACP methyl ester carboxylesterase
MTEADAAITVGDVDLGGRPMRVAEAGTGPAVVLLHGFPENWYSWRHQLAGLSRAGYRVIAPNQRGYDGTPGPPTVEGYDMLELTGDVVALLDALELADAVVAGHDWGAVVAWSTALVHPERVRAVGGFSVPHGPRPQVPYTEMWRRQLGEDFYMLWLQQLGVADALFDADIERALEGRWVVDRAGWQDTPVGPPPPWQTEADRKVYVDALARSGFTGPLNWYRNWDRNWELLAPYAGRTIDQPSFFVGGSDDPVLRFMPPAMMDGQLTDLRESLVLENTNHWVQQERPTEANAALLRFLSSLR